MTIETTKATAYDFSIASLYVKSEVINGRVYWYGDNSDNLSTRYEKTSRGCGRRAKTVGNPWKRISKAAATEILAKYSITLEQFRAYENGELETAAEDVVNTESAPESVEVVNSDTQETVDTAAEVSESAPKTVEQAQSTIEFCEYAFRHMELSDEAFDKCLAEYKAAKAVIDNAAKIAELKAEHDKVTEKMYADETSEATARRLRATRREIRDEIKALETEQEVTELELTASMKLAAEIIASLGEGEVKFSHAGAGKNGGLALHYDLDDGSEFGTGISLVEVFTDKEGYILDHVNVIKLNPVKTVKTYNFIQPVDPTPTDEPTGTPEVNAETTEQVAEVNTVETEAQEVSTEEVSVSELVAAPAAEISPDAKLAELFSAGKKAWEAQRDKTLDSPETEAFNAAKKAITKFLDTTRSAFKAALPENIIVADNWREGEFSGSSDLPSFVIRDLKTGKTLGTYKTLTEVKAAIEGNIGTAQEVNEAPNATTVDEVKADNQAGIAKAKELSKKLLTPEFRAATIAGEPLSQMWIAFNGDDRTFHVFDGWDHDEPFDTAQQVEDYIAELKTQIDTPPAPTPAAPSYKLRPEEEVERERKETRHLGRIFDEIFQEELAAAKTVDTFTAKVSELKENIGFALDATADAAANLAYAKIAYDNAQFQFSVAEDIKIKAEQSYREFVFAEAKRLNSLPLVDKVCNARNLCLTVVFDVKTQLFKIEHGIAPVAGAKITLGAFKTPAQVKTFLQSLLPASNDTPPDKVEQIDGNKQIDPLAEIDAAEYAISPDALTFAVYEEEGQAYIARRKRETLADAKLAKAYAKAKKVIKIARYKDGRLEWQARKKNGEWSRNEFYAKRKLSEFGIEWIEFLTFQEAEAEEAKTFRKKAPDSLARAMETALLKVQEHCRKHDLKAAQREMAIYGICSEALRTLGKEV